MSEYESILELEKPHFITQLKANRSMDQGKIEVSLQTSQGKVICLYGHDELAEALSELLTAERFSISREVGSGKEFGTIRIECWVDGCYSEFLCDTAK